MKTILVLGSSSGQRESIIQWLESSYRCLGAGPREASALMAESRGSTDLIIVDLPCYRALAQSLKSARKPSDPSFLHVLLAVSKPQLRALSEEGLPYYDDVLLTPLNEAELRIRVSALLRLKSISGDRQKDGIVKLRDSESHLQTIIDAEPECVKMLDRNGRVLQMNPAGIAMLEAESSEQVLGQSVYSFISSEYKKRFLSSIESVFQGNKEQLEFEIVGLRGTKRWMESHAVPLRDSGGNVIALLAVTRDNTIRKRADEALRRSEELYRTLAENFPNGAVVLVDTNLRLTIADGHAFNEAGISPQDIIGKTVREVLPPATYHVIGPRLLSTLDGEPNVFEATLGERHYEIRTIPVRNEHDTVVACMAMVQNITERKLAEETLRESQAFLQQAQEVGQIGSWISGLGDDHSLYWSKETHRIFGVLESEFDGSVEMFFSLVHPDDVASVKDSVSAAIEHGTPYTADHRVLRRDGTLLWVHERAEVVRDRYGKPIQLIGVVQDITERKKAEESLRLSETRFRLLIEQSPLGIQHLAPDGTPVRVNKAWEHLWGMTLEDIEEYNILEDEHLLAQGIMPHIHRAFSGLPVSLPPLARVPDRGLFKGREIWTRSFMYPVKNPDDGSIREMILIHENITETKDAENALRMTDEKLRTLFEASPLAIVSLDTNGNIDTWNRASETLFGWKSAEVIGRPNPVDIHRHPEYGKSEVSVGMELRTRNKEGQALELSASMAPVFDSHGIQSGVLMVFTDIGERKKVETALRESEERYRSLIESARDAIFTISPSAIFTSMNVAFEKSTGWDREEWIGKSFADLLHPDDRAAGMQIFKLVLEGCTPPIQELRIRRKSGSYVAGELTATPQILNGVFVGLLGIARDISERKSLEERLRQAQKMESLGTLAGGVAHDFNNILAIIIGHAAVLGQGNNSPARLAQSVESIAKAAQRGAGVVRQLLTFARKTETQFELANINAILQETARLLEETFPKSIVFQTNYSNLIPPITADGNQLHQAVLNLCLNARDAMPSGGVLTLGSSVVPGERVKMRFAEAQSHAYVCLTVGDTGHGLDEEVRHRMYEPFFTTKDRGKGTGLGLAVVFGIVQNHHGFIDVESERDKGTVFHLYFPAPSVPIPTNEKSSTNLERAIGGSETVLFVEDEHLLLELMVNLLTAKGYTVLAASDGEKAVEIFRERHGEISLVVSDIGLPKLSGWEAFGTMRKINPSVQGILASGYIDPSIRSTISDMGCSIVQKPYTPSDLLELMKSLLRDSRSR